MTLIGFLPSLLVAALSFYHFLHLFNGSVLVQSMMGSMLAIISAIMFEYEWKKSFQS